jgi:hypothetical protein
VTAIAVDNEKPPFPLSFRLSIGIKYILQPC